MLSQNPTVAAPLPSQSPSPAGSRIAPVDGLRAVAVLGVLWAHVWAFCGTPSWSLGRLGPLDLDLNRALSMMGTGVDLFFVISGFCMYLMYARKQERFDWLTYAHFLRKRWRRIAPAFYVAIIGYSLVHVWRGEAFPWRDALAHATFTGIWFTNPGWIYAPFWSLATEWHFYLLLPLFVASVARFGFRRVIGLAFGLSLLCSAFYFGTVQHWPLGEVVQANLTYQIPLRLAEFLWGICVARRFQQSVAPPLFLRGSRGVIVGFCLAFLGRACSVGEVLAHAGPLKPLLHAVSLPVLSLGYALALWSVISGASLFTRLLCLPPMQAIGRWSYSFYLWHGAVYLGLGALMVHGSNSPFWMPHLLFWVSLLLLVPVSYFSYCLFEAPYFLLQKKAVTAPTRSFDSPQVTGISTPKS